jgi:hypothetical protein
MKKNQILVVIILGTALMLPLASNAQTTASGNAGKNFHKPGINRTINGSLNKRTANNTVAGTVATINNATLTITDKKGVTYTVDTSAAKLIVGMSSPSAIITSIQTGDKVFVSGTITGTTVAAKTIRDQSLVGRIIFNGKVTTVAGNLITINFRKTSYVIDASAATITSGIGKNAKTITPADIKTGDMVTAVGTLNGTTVSATSIRDIVPIKHGTGRMKGKNWIKPTTSNQ